MAGPRFLVVGAGGIGGIVAAHLVETGHEVVTVTTNATIATALRTHGYRVRGESGERAVPADARTSVPDEPFDFVLLATQPPSVEDAARSAIGALAPEGAMVCFQNGLCEARIAKIAGADRTLGAVVAWGAAMPEPGLYDHTAAGGFTLGRIDARPDPRLALLARAFEAIGPTEVTENLAGKRWSKLAINCAVSSLGTLGGDRVGPLLAERFVRRLALEIMTETAHVARGENVRIEKVAGTLDLGWLALTPEERRANGSPTLLAKHALLLAVGFRYRRMRSSMLSAIERGRTPAVDFLNGEVVDRGAQHGVATPVNEAIRRGVWDVAQKRATSSLALLRRIFDETGPRGRDTEA